MDGGGGTGWLVGWLVVQLSLYKKDSPLWMFNCGKVIFKRDVELRKKVNLFRKLEQSFISPTLALFKYYNRQFRCWLGINLFWVLISYFT